MKIIERGLLSFQEKHFFVPIRDKIDYVRILVLGARQLLLNIEMEEEEQKSSLKLVVDKMSRLFFYKEEKFFSISFPFIVLIEDNEIKEISSYSGKKLNNKSISAILSIIESEQFKINPSLIDFYIEPTSIESSGVFLLEEIFQFEPSYIRYDFDPENEKGLLHPLNHLDVNYSQHSTFKIGLKEAINQNYFEDMQNTNTECKFIDS